MPSVASRKPAEGKEFPAFRTLHGFILGGFGGVLGLVWAKPCNKYRDQERPRTKQRYKLFYTHSAIWWGWLNLETGDVFNHASRFSRRLPPAISLHRNLKTPTFEEIIWRRAAFRFHLLDVISDKLRYLVRRPQDTRRSLPLQTRSPNPKTSPSTLTSKRHHSLAMILGINPR